MAHEPVLLVELAPYGLTSGCRQFRRLTSDCHQFSKLTSDCRQFSGLTSDCRQFDRLTSVCRQFNGLCYASSKAHFSCVCDVTETAEMFVVCRIYVYDV